MTLARELVVLVDDERGLVVTGTAASHDVVSLTTTAAPGDDLMSLLARAGLPQHAVIVAPHAGGFQQLHKGLRDLDEIAEAVTVSAAASSDGRARIESDLRAHCSPSRRTVIAAAARDLAGRLARRCPACDAPGWGVVAAVVGLQCAWCHGEVQRLRAKVHGCPGCEHRAEVRVVAEDAVADPGECPRCNP